MELAVSSPDEPALAYRERALFALRAGDLEDAKQWAAKGRAGKWSFDTETQNQLIEAIALFRLGKTPEASAGMQTAVREMQRGYPSAPASFGFGLDWNEWVCFELLRREAAALIK